jgi:hypothetical protein
LKFGCIYILLSFGISRAEFASFGREAKLREVWELQLPAEEAILYKEICTPTPYLLYVNLYVEDVKQSLPLLLLQKLKLSPHVIQ